MGVSRRGTERILIVIASLALWCGWRLWAQDGQGEAAQAPAARALGTVKTISGRNITLTADAGNEINVMLVDGARLLRVEPGEKDLKNAAPLALEELQAGDRVLVRGKMGDDGKSLAAASLIAMKKADITQKRSHEREEWQKHGVGGLVSEVDAASGTIVITTTGLGGSKKVAIHTTKETVLRRYSAGSVKFDEAKAAPLAEVKAGDQLRARGSRSGDGGEVTADEIVSGSFRNIAGTISAIDASGGTITVMDLATKKLVEVRVSGETQIRKLPAPMAQRIAARLKGASGEAAAPSGGEQKSGETAATSGAAGGRANGRPDAGQPGQNGPSAQGPADLQQALGRMPAATLGELNKGDAVMIVATAGTENGGVVAITLLGGVEPILEASPKNGQSILTPWSLSSGGADAAP